jgi:hypothetical protein
MFGNLIALSCLIDFCADFASFGFVFCFVWLQYCNQRLSSHNIFIFLILCVATLNVDYQIRNDIIYMDESVNPAWSARLRSAIARAAVPSTGADASVSASASAISKTSANASANANGCVDANVSTNPSSNASANASSNASANANATIIGSGRRVTVARLLAPPPALIAAHRAVKSSTELNAMRAAAKISADGAKRSGKPSPLSHNICVV